MAVHVFSHLDMLGIDDVPLLLLLIDAEIAHPNFGRGVITNVTPPNTRTGPMKVTVSFGSEYPPKVLAFKTISSKPGFELRVDTYSELYEAIMNQRSELDAIAATNLAAEEQRRKDEERKVQLERERQKVYFEKVDSWKRELEEELQCHLDSVLRILEQFSDDTQIISAACAIASYLELELVNAALSMKDLGEDRFNEHSFGGYEALHLSKTQDRIIQQLQNWSLKRNFGLLAKVSKQLRLEGFQVLSAPLALYQYPGNESLYFIDRRRCVTSASNSYIDLGQYDMANSLIREVIYVEEDTRSRASEYSLKVLYKLLRRYPGCASRPDELEELYAYMSGKGWLGSEDDTGRNGKKPIVTLADNSLLFVQK